MTFFIILVGSLIGVPILLICLELNFLLIFAKLWQLNSTTNFSFDRTVEVTNANHRFISLSNPKQEVVTALIKYVFEDIWKLRCNKVKREIFERRFKNG